MDREDAGPGGDFGAVGKDETLNFAIFDVCTLGDGGAGADVDVVLLEDVDDGVDEGVAAVFDAGEGVLEAVADAAVVSE